MSRGRYDDATAVLEQGARINGHPLPPSGIDLSTFTKDSNKDDGVFTQYAAMLSHRRLLVRTIIVFGIWIVNAGLYYGLAFYSVALGGNAYVNFFLGGLVEIPAYIGTVWLYNRYGRRWPLALIMALSGGALFGIFLIGANGLESTWPTLVVALATGAKLCITASFSMAYIFR